MPAGISDIDVISPDHAAEIEATTPSKMINHKVGASQPALEPEISMKMPFYNTIRFYSRFGRIIYTIEEFQSEKHKLFRVARVLNTFTQIVVAIQLAVWISSMTKYSAIVVFAIMRVI
jgi:hypothetical protein